MSVFLNLICPCFKEEEKPLNELGFEKTIKKIKELNKGNKKLCCYVGRVLKESVPKVKGEIWVSLDESRGDEPHQNRLHLQVNFHSKSMEKLKGLFDKVVVDQSVTRGCNWWLNLGFLLKEKPNSTLISPALPQQYSDKSFYGTIEGFKKKQKEVSEPKPNSIIVILHRNRDNPIEYNDSQVSDHQFNVDFDEEKKYRAKRVLEEIENILRRTKIALEKFFTRVKLVREENYPYKMRGGYNEKDKIYTYEWTKMDYFECKGPQKDLYQKTRECFNKII